MRDSSVSENRAGAWGGFVGKFAMPPITTSCDRNHYSKACDYTSRRHEAGRWIAGPTGGAAAYLVDSRIELLAANVSHNRARDETLRRINAFSKHVYSLTPNRGVPTNAEPMGSLHQGAALWGKCNPSSLVQFDPVS